MKRSKLRVISFFLGLVTVLLSWTSYGAEFELYTVQKGDTLYSLAKSCGISVNDLLACNGLSTSDIKIGDVLKLPQNNGDSAAESTRSSMPTLAVSVAAAIPQISTESRPSLDHTAPTSAEQYRRKYHLTTEEYELLVKLVYAESRGEPLEGQIAVAAVVLNRVSHSSFPNNVKEVIMEPGQFMSVDNGMINLTPGDEARRAVDLALQGQDPSQGALFFYNPRKSKALAWWNTRVTTAVIGDHNFAI